MLKPILFLLAGLAAGIGTAVFWPDGAARDAQPTVSSDGLSARVAALESALNRETLRRAELEDELAMLRARIDRTRATAAAGFTADGVDAPAALERAGVEVEPADEPVAQDVLRFGRERNAGEDLASRLVAAGFAFDRADWIATRSDELRMAALQAQYEARRDGTPFDRRAFGTDALRTELGEAEYERYLEAVGRPTSVRIDGIMASSPAEQAGLLPGDRVVAYGGERVFDVGDLNSLVLEGQPGQPVTVDVLRDGQPIQLVLPRGPLGVWGPGRGRGR